MREYDCAYWGMDVCAKWMYGKEGVRKNKKSMYCMKCKKLRVLTPFDVKQMPILWRE